jgi:hypothetical protein
MVKLTLLISGPLHQNVIDTVKKHFRNKEIPLAVSTWAPQNEDEQQLFYQLTNIGVSFIVCQPKDLPNTDVGKQVYCWRKGLSIVKTEYCLKISSCLYVGDLKPLVENATMDTILSCNMGFVPSIRTLYHPSDLVIGMSKKDAIATCESILKGFVFEGAEVPEQVICMSALVAKGCKEVNESMCVEHMKKYYRIVDLYFLDAVLDTPLGRHTKRDFECNLYFLRNIDHY